ncbi:MAG: hypothetical protein HN480_02150 [Gammaproteobacteria bacterium]|nr:hypothetical protein [Gammaproteobacteria bacterium]MBT7523329.1 hypothetical protein [Gammaproteobacteria bacterium]
MKFIKYIVIILIAYLVISLTAARILVANAENNINFFENYISNSNITGIAVEKITSDWKGLYPSIEIFLSRKNKDSSKIYFDNVKINLNIYKSVVLLRPVIKEIYLKNIYYETSVKEILVIFNRKKLNNNIVIENIKIKKSNFIIKYNKSSFDLNNVNILIKNNNLIIDANIDDNKKFACSIKNIKVKGSKLINFDYKIKINGKFNYNFENIFYKHKLIINNSDLFITTSGNFSNGYLVKNKFSILTDKKSNIILNNNVINNINSRLILDGNVNQNVKFEINELNFLSKNNNYYSFNDTSGSISSDNGNVSIFSKKLDINLENFHNDYDLPSTNNIYFSGLVKNLKMKFNLLNFYNEFYVSGDFIKSNISSDTGYIRNFSGYIEASNKSTFVKFYSKNVEIQYKSMLRDRKLYESIYGEVEFSNYSNLLLNIYDLSIVNNEIDINTSGIIDFSKDSIKVLSSINFIDMTKVTDYIPLSLMSEKSSSWFKKSFLSGYSRKAFIMIDGNLSNYPFYDNNNGLSYAVFPIKKLTVDYKKNWVPFENIDGFAYFNNRKAQFNSDEFNVLKTKAINTMLEIDDVKNIELILTGILKGPFNDLLKYSNTASLTSVANRKVINIKGNSETDFRIKIGINGTKNDYRSTIRLNNISFNMDENNSIAKINGKILFKNNLFFTDKNEYITASYNNKDIKFSLSTLKDNSFIIKGVQEIDISKNTPSNNYSDKILGSSLWNYKLIIPGFNSKSKKIKLSAVSNLYGTSIILPKPFYKNKDIKKNISINAFLENNKLYDINIIYNGIYAELSSLDKISGYINFSGKKLKLPNNRFNIIGKLDVINIDDWKALNKNGTPINYFDYINKIDLNIGQLISNNIILDNFSAKGYRSNKSFLFNKIEVNSDKVRIRSNGKIEFGNISSFKVNLSSENLEILLNYWKFTHSLRDSSIDSIFDISWQGGLFDFSLDKIYGEFNTTMTNGRLKKVGNRATRIFGLFNIDLLVKRLSLDFDDVTKNGFYYNTLSGDFRIEGGNIFTTNLLIKGPAAEMLAVGTTDIINETYDMQVVASPEFGEALPAIALLGGPITAAATFAAEKLAKAFGKDINDLIKIKYKVSGSWDKPILKVIEKNGSALENVEDLFK